MKNIYSTIRPVRNITAPSDYRIGIIIPLILFLCSIPELAFTQASGSQTLLVATPSPFNAPTGVTKVNVQVWGGGGGGGGVNGGTSVSRGGGGGGGGGFNSATNVTVGPTTNFTIGAGGTAGDENDIGGTGGTTTFSSGSPVSVAGGTGGGFGTSGAGNEFGAGGTGQTAGPQDGGNGAAASLSGGGGGGGGAGTTGNGGNATANTGGSGGTSLGGGGANGPTATGAGTAGTVPGGGGSGAFATVNGNLDGGVGGAGQIIVSWTLPSTFTTGSVTTVGGTIRTGFWNGTNTSVNIVVPVENNSELTGGSIQLKIDKDGGASYTNIGSAYPIVIGDLGTNVTMNITEAVLEALAAEYAETNVLTITARITDNKGNFRDGTASATTLTVDTTAPAAPATPDLTAATDLGYLNTDDITADNTPDFTGSGTNGFTVTITSDGSPVGSATVAGGVYTITASTLADGVRAIRATTTDLAGNTSSPSGTALSVTINTAAVAAPTIPDLTTDTGASAVDDITNDNTPDFQTTGTVGLRLEILDGGTVVGTIASASGAAETITASVLSDGVRSITARTMSVSGVTASSAALPVTIDILPPAAPAAPDLTPGTDSGQSNTDDNTNDNTPDFTGSGTNGFTVTILSDAVPVGSGVVAGGTYTITTSTLADGTRSITATTTDIAGNPSLPSPALSVMIDILPPAAPTAPDLQIGSDSGASNSDNITNDNTPSFDVTGTSGFRLELIDGASTVVATIASASGAIQTMTATTLSDGPHTMKARTTDVAGNFTDGPTLGINIITAPPATPSVPDLQAGSDTGSSSIDNNTTDTTPTFDITGSAGLLLELRDGTTVVGTIASATGALESITSSALADGPHNMNARTTDLAGNVSVSANLAITIDTSFPSVTSIVANTATTIPNGYAPLVNGVTTPPTTTVVFRVTFNDNVTGVDLTDFIVNTNGPAFGGVTVTPFSQSIYDVSVTGLTGTGTVNIDLNDDNTIADLAGNILGGALVDDGDFNTSVALGNNQFFTLALPQPSGAVSALNVPTVTSNSIDVSWTDIAAAQAPTHYLVMLKTAATPSFDLFGDGNFLADDADLSDGDLKINVAQGIGTASFSVNSGVDYNLIIYPYTLDANSIVLGNRTTINYFTATPATNNATTPTAQQTLISAGNGIASISSLDTSAPSFRAVFTFTVQDDGTNPGDDDSPFRFQTLTINADNANGNTIANWSQAIANTNARLSDNFGHSQTANITVNAGSIVISSIASSSAADLGFIPDNGTKIYTLEVFLRSSLLGNLPQSIDGLRFVMDVDEFDFGYNDTGLLSSRIRPGETTFSGSGNGLVSVVATRLNFTTQPPANPYVLTNIVSTSAAPDFSTTPVVRARDINGNTDLGYSNTITISNTGAIPMLNLLPVNTLSLIGGIATFPVNFQYQDDGNGTLTAAVGGLISGNSSAVTVVYDNNNRITAGAFAEPIAISSLLTGPGFNSVFDFNIVDDNFAGGDGAPTRFTQLVVNQLAGNDIADWTEAIASARLVQGITIIPGTVNATNITFGGLANTLPSDPGFIADNGSKNYILQIILRSTMGGTLAQSIDNLNFNFQMTEANVILIPTTSSDFTAVGTQATNSGAGNNAVQVIATTLRFSTQPNATLLPQIDISAQAPVNVPVVRAEDVNNNVDLDYTNGATISSALNVSPSIFLTAASGVYTYPGTFRYTETGNGTMTVSAPGLLNAVSNAVSVQAGTATTITAGAASPATISSLVNTSGAAVAAFNFNVNDDPGGTPAGNNDGLPTLISQIVIRQNVANNTIADWTQALLGAILTDGTNSINAIAISPTSITFGGISTAAGQLGFVGDNLTKNYSVRVYLRTTLGGTLPVDIDGRKFEFQVTQGPDITLATNSTGIIAAETETSGNANVVTVVASALRFISPTVPGTVSLDTDFPGVTVEAVDANNNRDLGYTQLVRNVSNPASAGMSNQPTNNVTPFVAGVLSFAPNFRYTSGASGANVTLTVVAGPVVSTACGGGNICTTSPTLTLLSSFESIVMGDPTYNYLGNIPYVQHQEASNIQETPSSVEIARMLLIDGSRVNYNYGGFLITTGTNIDAVANGDEDGAETRLNSITINISNPATLRRIALYSGSTELGEINVDALNIPDGTANQDFTFSGGPLLIAPDNSTSLVPVALSLRASFLSTAPEITDGDLITVRVANAVLASGSNFFNSPPFIGGVSGGYQSPGGFNRLNVTATKLDFVTQPAAFAGRNEPVIGAAIVHARDQFNVLDTDFNTLPSPSIVTSQGSANVLGSFAFTGGVLNMNGLITYGNPGIGTLTVTAGGLSSLTNLPAATPPNVAVQCTRVDVIHVGTVRQDGGPGGVPNGGALDQVSLLAGSTDQVLFGFTFSAPHGVTGPNNPRVSRFTFSFNNSISGIFNNIRVFESTTGQFSVATQVPAGNVTPGTQTIVDFTATPKDLTLFPNLTYFIMADVDPAVGGTTSNMKVSILDGGVGSPTQNNIQVVSNIGSQLANTSGPTFNFAAVAPPTLVDTYPRIGQTNLDPTQPTLEMTFSVPVYTLDQQVRLYRKGISPAPDVLVATLTAANGFPFAPSGVGAAKPIIFNIPPGTLAADNEYYVFIAPGNLSTNTGISDASRNLFPGIDYPGTFFFRTASPVAPKLLGSGTTPAASAGDPIATDITNNGGTINATFDKLGKAYYIVCSTNNPTPPTNAEVISGIYPANTVVASGQFDIGATHTISQFGNFSVPGGFTAGSHYVWITAESFAEKKVGAVISQTGFLATSPYGSSAFDFATVGGPVSGPTFNFPAPGPSPTPLVTTNGVTISMCSNSFQVLNTPIIIYEGTNPGQTFASPTPDQQINIVLPAGFEFDDSETEILPGVFVPTYGKVDLIGADFVGPGSISFLSTSVLRITFTNNGGFGSKDQIVLRNLRIRSNGSRVGDIFRLGGLGIPAINDGTTIARLSAQEAPIISFDNSYSLSLGESWALTTFSETAIPDNAFPAEVTLVPYIPNPFDFGPTTFTGQGVNINRLNVKGVTLDVPFNITVTHTDQNGCISDNPVQFVVYDDARAIVITRPGQVNIPATIPTNLSQGPYCSSIPTFQINQQFPSPAAPGVVRDVFYNNLDAYYMETLVAAIPTTSVAGTHIINSTDFGGAWTTIVSGLPQIVGTQIINSYTFRDYQFDDKRIVNASAISGGTIPYVYDNFKVPKTPSTPGNYAGNNITYYNGGSLGFVEFTGTFRNIANPIVKINRRQIVEFYVPAVPVVELVTPYSDLITNDPQNLPSAGSNPNNLNNPGTFVFCEAGGLITVNGWPKAEPTAGTQGVFRIYNAAVGGTQIMTGLTDFGTGIAQINPADAGIKNGNNNIRIEYEFRDANSPNGTCLSIGSQVIRISPNPTAVFTQVSLPNSFVDATNPTAYCEGKPIRFDASGSNVSGGGAVIETYTWLFDDATNSISANPNLVTGLAGGLAVPGSPGPIPPASPAVPAAGTNDFPVHYYKDFNTYNPTLVITSNFNCQSVPATNPVKVGGIPDVKLVFDGTHAGAAVADAFHFQSNNSVISANDHFKRLDIDFGDGATDFFSLPPSTPNDPLFNAEVFDHNYSVTGQMVYDFRITTEIGCVNSLSLNNTLIKGISAAEDQILRTLIVLPRFVVTPSNAYLETFEPAAANPSKIWQAWYAGAFTQTPAPPAITPIRSIDPTWQLGVPSTKFLPTVNGTNIWTTSLTGTYVSGERSAVYSPSFDLSTLTRPMISLDTYTQLEAADGVVLQYSIDNKNIADPTKVWKVLGTELDGEFWYTDRGIAAKPGDQVGNDYGWSRNTKDEWLSSRHALVDAGTSVIITDPRVVFRLALGSAATSIDEEGFGFDNVRIGERTRTILLESFTNSANDTKSPTTPGGFTSDEEYESSVISGFNAALVGLEVVKLNYHVNFPGNDPFNKSNPADPSSRALFYNVNQTPAARLDGYSPTPYTPFSDWGQNSFNTRTLRLAQASIVIRPATPPDANITNSGTITFFVDVIPTVDLDPKTILHIGIVEQLVPLASLSTTDQDMIKTGETSFEYVAKKLLPSASGTRTSTHPNAVGGVLVAPPSPAPPATYTFGPFEWSPILNQFYAPSTGDLGVIAFLQREDGDKEVYQAEIVLSLDDPPSSLVTSLEPLRAEDVKVYPNPANHDMTVQLPGEVSKAASLQLIDQTGRTALKTTISEGNDRKTFSVSDLSSGVYILTVDMGSGVLTRKKVIVVHQD